MKYLNEVVCKDNLELLKELPSESVDLVYIDPPFFTQRKHDIKGVGFQDKWHNLIHYREYIKVRLIQIHRILKETGSIFLHCDWRTSHHLRFMLDEIFGEKNFRNEIIWKYRTGGASKKCFNKKHDNLFWYSKDYDVYSYNSIKVRNYYEKKYFNTKIDSKGRHYYDSFPGDVWEIKSISNLRSERLDYPTQKPEALLKRIIRDCSNEGDTVADFFCGSGTTPAVAKKLGRQYIGCDSNPDAVRITKERLDGIATG